MLSVLKALLFRILEYLISCVPVFPTPFLHIERGAHGVLDKNKNNAKFFYSRLYNNLPPKIPCGRTPIFARGAHVRAKGREKFLRHGLPARVLLFASRKPRDLFAGAVFFKNLIAEP
jgi:hypothetical protein